MSTLSLSLNPAQQQALQKLSDGIEGIFQVLAEANVQIDQGPLAGRIEASKNLLNETREPIVQLGRALATKLAKPAAPAPVSPHDGFAVRGLQT